MSDPNLSRIYRCYYPSLSPDDCNVTSEKLSNYFKYPSESVTLYFMLPIGSILSDCATMWGQKSPRKGASHMIEVHFTHQDCICFLTVMNGDLQVDVYQNGERVPAQIILASPIPNETEDAFVAMGFFLILQAYNKVHYPCVAQKVEDDFKEHAAALEAEAEAKGKPIFVKPMSDRERDRREKLERIRRGPDVLLDFAHFIHDNSNPHKSKETLTNGACSMYSIRTIASRSREEMPTFRYTNMTVRKYAKLCAVWKGALINVDQANNGLISSKHNPCNPINVYDLNTFITKCRHLKAHPAYCDSTNYWQTGSDSIVLPLDGKYFYRLNHEDTRPGNGIPSKNQHGLMNTYFPHFKKPSLLNDPNVFIYNILNGKSQEAASVIDPVCEMNFSNCVEVDTYETAKNIAKQMNKKFHEIDKTYKDNPEMRYQETTKAQREGLDAMFSYFHRDGGVSESHKSVLEWFEEFLAENNGSAFLYLHKTTDDLSWFANKINTMIVSLDGIFAIRTLHSQALLFLASAFSACAMYEKMGLNMMNCGAHDSGKSFLCFLFRALLIAATIVNTISESDKANSDGTNLSSNRVEIKDESDPEWLATKQGGGDYGASSKNSRTKNQLTTGETEIPRLQWDAAENRWKKVLYKTILLITYWVNFNGDPNKMYDGPNLDRFLVETILKDQVDPFVEQRAMEISDITSPQFNDTLEKVSRRFRHNQALCVLVGQAYHHGIYKKGINISVCNDKFAQVEKDIMDQNSGLTTPGRRLKSRFKALCRIFTIINAVSMVWESEASTECYVDPVTGAIKGKKFQRYDLTKVEPYLVASPEIVAFVITLMKSQFEPRVVTEILSVMRDVTFRVDKQEKANEANEKKQAQQQKQQQQPRKESKYNNDGGDDDDEWALLQEFEQGRDEFEQKQKQQQAMDEEENHINDMDLAVQLHQQDKKRQEERKQQDFLSLNELRKNGFATICPIDKFYIQRTYGEDKFYTQLKERASGVAHLIHNNYLQSIGITMDNIESLLKQLQRTKYIDHDDHDLQKPGLVYCDNAVRIARCALEGVTEHSKLQQYVINSFTKEDLIGKYDILLGTMKPYDRYHFYLYPIQKTIRERPPTRKRKQRITINTSYADPGTIAVLAAVTGEDITNNNPDSNLLHLFDNTPASIVDSSIYEKCVLELRNALGITYEIEQKEIGMPISISEWNIHLDLVAKRNKHPPIFPFYNRQFLNVNKEIQRIVDLLDDDNHNNDDDGENPAGEEELQKKKKKQKTTRTRKRTSNEIIKELKSLPKLSTKLDRCISEATRDESSLDEALPKLKRHMSVQEESNRIRKKLKLAPLTSTDSYEPKRMLSLSESMGLSIPSKPLILPSGASPVISSSPSASTSSDDSPSYHDEDESSLIDSIV